MTERDKTHIDRIPDAELREIVRSAQMEFPVRMRSLRKGCKCTLREIAGDIGMSWQQLDRYERGEDLPKFTNLRLLAAYYGVSVDWLMGEDWAE